MKLALGKKTWLALCMALTLAYAGWTSGNTAYQAHQIEEAQSMSEELFKPDAPQTACFGRMTLELPKGARLRGSTYEYRDFKIEETSNVTRAGFDQTVDEFEAKLKSTKHEVDPSLLAEARDVPNAGKLFVHWEENYSTVLRRITGFAWRDDVQYALKAVADPVDYDDLANKVSAILATLRSRPENEVPAEHGFCLNTAFIPDALNGEELERAEIYLPVRPWEGVSINIETWVNQVKEPATLLQRLAVGRTRPGFSKTYSEIRSGERKIGDLSGQELLLLVTEEDDKYFHFRWEYEGALHSNNPPDIVLELRVKQLGKPGEMTKAQALALWEFLLPRLKVRAVKDSKTTDHGVPIKAALGEQAVTGRTCPQAGWWECIDDLPLAQPRGVFLCEGDTMPYARVWGQPTFWDRLRGDRPRYRMAAMWRLTAYEGPTKAQAAPQDNAPVEPAPPGAEA
jgi:Tle cognate immunity protein 4 C-terminal domain/Tle cognate immunity protein 4 N-terminal domain